MRTAVLVLFAGLISTTGIAPQVEGRRDRSTPVNPSPPRRLPSFATMGDMGAYWSTSARLGALDASHFLDQVATMAQLTGELMIANLNEVKPAAPSRTAP